MLHQLISHNSDLKQLSDEGYAIEIRNGYLLIHDIPYVNSNKVIKFGTLVSTLNYSSNQVLPPETHVIHFTGEFPCDRHGKKIEGIDHSSETRDLGNGIIVNFSFSNKPKNGYSNYYEKVTQYIKIISSHAKSLNKFISEKTHKVIIAEDEESVFNYFDSNSSRAEISNVSEKLSKEKIAIIGLGGTGSYILDLIAKTEVQEIHLFDGDFFLQHNAFRAPGAPTLEILSARVKKTDYLVEIYSKMRKKIFSHNNYLSTNELILLKNMDFVFVCMDVNKMKKELITYLNENNIKFIDVGMGIQKVENKLTGILRVTSVCTEKYDFIFERIPFEKGPDNEYIQNIQIAELNALSASLAVIKWKKMLGFYADFGNENNSLFSINTNSLVNESFET